MSTLSNYADKLRQKSMEFKTKSNGHKQNDIANEYFTAGAQNKKVKEDILNDFSSFRYGIRKQVNDKFQGYTKFFEQPANSSTASLVQTKKASDSLLDEAFKSSGFSNYQKKEEVGRSSVGGSLKGSSQGLEGIQKNLKSLVTNSGRKPSDSNIFDLKRNIAQNYQSNRDLHSSDFKKPLNNSTALNLMESSRDDKNSLQRFILEGERSKTPLSTGLKGISRDDINMFFDGKENSTGLNEFNIRKGFPKAEALKAPNRASSGSSSKLWESNLDTLFKQGTPSNDLYKNKSLTSYQPITGFSLERSSNNDKKIFKNDLSWSPPKSNTLTSSNRGGKLKSALELLPLQKLIDYQELLSEANESEINNLPSMYLKELIKLASLITRTAKTSRLYSRGFD